MKTALNFGGFYQSWHDEQLERAVAYACDLVDECGEIKWDEMYASINSWTPYREQYAEAWLGQFNDEIGTSLAFEGINSPREYNFRTDAIMASMTTRDALALFKYVRENDLKNDVFDRMREITTSRDGYLAFYSYRDLFKRENRDLLMECLCDAIIEEHGGMAWIVEDFEADYIPALEAVA